MLSFCILRLRSNAYGRPRRLLSTGPQKTENTSLAPLGMIIAHVVTFVGQPTHGSAMLRRIEEQRRLS